MSRAEAWVREPLGSGLEGASRPGRAPARSGRVEARSAAPEAAEQARLRRVFDEQFGFVWRYVRRLGLPDGDADDATQQVFLVLARRLHDVAPGKERAFLCGTAVRVVSDHRRAAGRRKEVLAGDGMERSDGGLRPDELVDRDRARALLDQVLAAMPMDLRAVFVLFELEEMAIAEIADLLGLPTGTAASRLRRARERFRAIVKRFRACGTLPGACS